MAARLLVIAVGLCGAAVVGHSALSIARSTLPTAWVLFSILTIVCGTLTIKIPSIQSRFSLCEVFSLASCNLFGPEVGALTLALDGLRISAAWSMNRLQNLFYFANLGLSLWLNTGVFFPFSDV